MAVLACVALFGAGGAAAEIFTTSASVQDFRFDELDHVLYTNPSLDQVSMELSADNRVVITSIDGADVSTDPGGNDVVGKLQLTGTRVGDGYRGEYYLHFGTMIDTETASTSYLMNGALDAMESGTDDDGLKFLFSGPTTGAKGTEYQRFGLFAEVAGIGVEDWLNQYDASASTMNLVASADTDPDFSSPAAPIPATPLLLLTGLFGLRFARGRGRR